MSTGSDEELVHEFRVQFKKIRAIVRLTGNLKTPPSLKELYTAAGKVRELQLLKNQLFNIQSVDQLPQFYAFIDNQISITINTLKNKAANGYEKEIETLLNNAKEHLTTKQVQKFIDKKTAALDHKAHGANKADSTIHDARKIIKDLIYSFHTLEEMELEKFYLSSAEKEFLHTISIELGIFQDWCTILSYLSLTKLRSLPEAEKQALKKIRVNFLRTKREAKAIIIHQLNELSLIPIKTS